jgi:DNA-binding protein Fis
MSRTIEIPAEGKSLSSIVSEAVHRTLELTGGNQAKAARILQISRPTLAKYKKSMTLLTNVG